MNLAKEICRMSEKDEYSKLVSSVVSSLDRNLLASAGISDAVLEPNNRGSHQALSRVSDIRVFLGEREIGTIQSLAAPSGGMGWRN